MFADVPLTLYQFDVLFLTALEHSTESNTTDGLIKVEKLDKPPSSTESVKSEKSGDHPSNNHTTPNNAPRRPLNIGTGLASKRALSVDNLSEEDDEDLSPGTKVEREKVRRQANNARERCVF